MSSMFGNMFDDDDLVDDMIMLDILEDEDMDDYFDGGKRTGSCLMFLVAIGIAGAIPIVSIINLLA